MQERVRWGNGLTAGRPLDKYLCGLVITRRGGSIDLTGICPSDQLAPRLSQVLVCFALGRENESLHYYAGEMAVDLYLYSAVDVRCLSPPRKRCTATATCNCDLQLFVVVIERIVCSLSTYHTIDYFSLASKKQKKQVVGLKLRRHTLMLTISIWARRRSILHDGSAPAKEVPVCFQFTHCRQLRHCGLHFTVALKHPTGAV